MYLMQLLAMWKSLGDVKSQPIIQGLLKALNLFPLGLQSGGLDLLTGSSQRVLVIAGCGWVGVGVYSRGCVWLLAPRSIHCLASGVFRGASVGAGAALVLQGQGFNFEEWLLLYFQILLLVVKRMKLLIPYFFGQIFKINIKFGLVFEINQIVLLFHSFFSSSLQLFLEVMRITKGTF